MTDLSQVFSVKELRAYCLGRSDVAKYTVDRWFPDKVIDGNMSLAHYAVFVTKFGKFGEPEVTRLKEVMQEFIFSVSNYSDTIRFTSLS